MEFRIPRQWVEDYEPDGGGMYEPVPESNALRLNVITVRSPTVVNTETPAELLRPRALELGVPLDLRARTSGDTGGSTLA